MLVDTKLVDVQVALNKHALKDAMLDELISIEKNKHGSLSAYQQRKKQSMKWIYKLK